MSGRHSRTKGHSFERSCAHQFQELGFEARRQLEYHTDDANGVDLQGTDPFKVQCKRYKDYCPISKIEEVQCDRDSGEIPLLLTKGDRKETVAVLYWEDLRKLIEKKF